MPAPDEDDDEDRTVQAAAPTPAVHSRAEEGPDDFTEEASTVQRPVPESVASMRLKTPFAEDFDPEDTATTRGPAAGLYGKAVDAPVSSRLPVNEASAPRAQPRRPLPDEPPRVFGGVPRPPESGRFQGPKPARRAIADAAPPEDPPRPMERSEDSITARGPLPALPPEDPGPDAPDESITVMTREPGGAGPPSSTTAPFAQSKAASVAKIAIADPLPAELDGDSITTENARETRPTVPLEGSPVVETVAAPLAARRAAQPGRPPMLDPEILDPLEEEDIPTGVGMKDDPSITATMSQHIAEALRSQSSDPGPRPARASERRLEPEADMARTAQRGRPAETETEDSLARTSQRHAIDGGGVKSALAYGATSVFEPPPDVKQAMRDGHASSVAAARSVRAPQSTGLMQAVIDERRNAGMGAPPGAAAGAGPVLFKTSSGPPSFPASPAAPPAPPAPPSTNLLRALTEERASMRQPIPTPSGTVLPSLDPSAEGLTFAPPSFDPSSTAVLRGEVRLPEIKDSVPDGMSSPPAPMGTPPLPSGPPMQIHPLLSRQPPPAPAGEPRWALIVLGFALAAVLIPVATWLGIRAAREESIVPHKPAPARVSQPAEGRADPDPGSRTFRPRRR